MVPGVYHGVPMRDYLQTDAVSAGLLQTLLTQCPKAAWYESWLNTLRVDGESNKAIDTGTIGHDVLLEGGDIMQAIDPTLYPTKSSGNIPTGLKGNAQIKAAADAARAAGKIPILSTQIAEIRSMVASARCFIESLKDEQPDVWSVFQPDSGDSEVSIVWEENGTLCKIRPDRLSKGRTVIVDAKFTGTSAEPDTYGRTQLVRLGGYISAAWYRRGVKAVAGIEPNYYFLVVETSAPFLCSLIGVDPHGFELGAQKVEHALREWRACCERHQWPGYPARACYPEIPAWVDAEWTEKQIDSTPYWLQA